MGSLFSASDWSEVSEHKDDKTGNQHVKNSKKPKVADDKLIESKADDSSSYNFVYHNETNSSITRLSLDREMIIGIWEKGMIGHSSMFICYFSKPCLAMKRYLAVRVFCIELFVKKDTRENVLSIKGPVYETRDYKCKKFYVIHANMDKLVQHARETVADHGQYDYIWNNCKHFSKSYLENVKTRCSGTEVSLSYQILNEYIHKYSAQKESASERLYGDTQPQLTLQHVLEEYPL
eukprot:437184_1